MRLRVLFVCILLLCAATVASAKDKKPKEPKIKVTVSPQITNARPEKEVKAVVKVEISRDYRNCSIELHWEYVVGRGPGGGSSWLITDTSILHYSRDDLVEYPSPGKIRVWATLHYMGEKDGELIDKTVTEWADMVIRGGE